MAARSNPYRFDVIQDLKDEAIFRPAAEAIFMERVADFRRDDPVTNCLPGGPSEMLSATYRIMQSPTVVALLYESGTGRYRQIHMDGRKLPEDPNPTWLGYSVGRWEGDTLVVESAGFNDRTWLDRAGHPHSEKLRVTERFRRVDFGHMQYQITFDDPETLTKPLTFSLAVNYRADTDMLENVCNENNRDKVHMVGTASTGVQLSSAVLARYTGRYAFRDGSTDCRGLHGHEPERHAGQRPALLECSSSHSAIGDDVRVDRRRRGVLPGRQRQGDAFGFESDRRRRDIRSRTLTRTVHAGVIRVAIWSRVFQATPSGARSLDRSSSRA